MKHTFKDFADGKIYLHVSEAEWPGFACQCKEAGIRWGDRSAVEPSDNCGGCLPFNVVLNQLHVLPQQRFDIPVVAYCELVQTSNPRSITITFDGTDTTASLYVGDNLSQSALVKLLPGDDDGEYAKVCRAIARLYGRKPIESRTLLEAANDLFTISKGLQDYAGQVANTR